MPECPKLFTTRGLREYMLVVFEKLPPAETVKGKSFANAFANFQTNISS
jgi:hypothetical protein